MIDKQFQHNLYVSTTFFLSANDFDWNFGQDASLCASEHNQHLIVLLFKLPDCKWLFLANSWVVRCLNLPLAWLATVFEIGLKYWCTCISGHFSNWSNDNDLLGSIFIRVYLELPLMYVKIWRLNLTTCSFCAKWSSL